MKLDEDKLYIEVLELNEIKNCVVVQLCLGFELGSAICYPTWG